MRFKLRSKLTKGDMEREHTKQRGQLVLGPRDRNELDMYQLSIATCQTTSKLSDLTQHHVLVTVSQQLKLSSLYVGSWLEVAVTMCHSSNSSVTEAFSQVVERKIPSVQCLSSLLFHHICSCLRVQNKSHEHAQGQCKRVTEVHAHRDR